jgi:hypothetical protein
MSPFSTWSVGTVMIGLFVVGISAGATIAKPKVKELCVCGFNPREVCDEGNYKHSISDCYDEENRPCGYDDQVIGRCDALKRPRIRLKNPPMRPRSWL